MSVTEIKPGVVGYGQRRFVIRGQVYLPLDLAAALRPSYNEYPERFPIDPAFPAPGRRAGSRPAAQAGAALPSEAPEAGAPSEGGAPAARARPGVYPEPRKREAGSELTVGGNLPAPESTAGQALECKFGDGGDAVTRFREVAAATTEVFVSQQIGRPFVVRHIGWTVNTFHNDSGARVKIAPDNETTGGINTSGVLVPTLGPGTRSVPALNGNGHLYPNFMWTAVPAFVKLILENNSAGFIAFWVVVDLEYLA